jgi:hypothetical protein
MMWTKSWDIEPRGTAYVYMILSDPNNPVLYLIISLISATTNWLAMIYGQTGRNKYVIGDIYYIGSLRPEASSCSLEILLYLKTGSKKGEITCIRVFIMKLPTKGGWTCALVLWSKGMLYYEGYSRALFGVINLLHGRRLP